MLGHDVVQLLIDNSLERDGIINIVDAPPSRILDASYYYELYDYVRNRRKYDIIINCAAYTDTMGCEKFENREISYRRNVFIPTALARVCKNTGAKLIHISTNEVFSSRSLPIYPDDTVSPQYVYGLQKYVAEREIMRILPQKQYLIIRTSWLFGPHGNKSFVHKCAKNFVRYLSKPKTERDTLYGIVDEISTPTSTDFLAHFIINSIRRKERGIAHAIQSDGAVSRYVYMKEILHSFRVNGYFTTIADDDIAEHSYEQHTELRHIGRVELTDHLRYICDYPGCRWSWTSDLGRMIDANGDKIVEWAKQEVEKEVENAQP